MDQKTMVKQVFDFQKNTFDNFFKSVSTVQDQAEKSVNFMLERSPWLPEESKNVILEWGRIYKKGRDDLKRAMDDGYEKIETYIVTTAQATQQAAQQAAKSASEAAKSATDAGKKASEQPSKSAEGKAEARPS